MYLRDSEPTLPPLLRGKTIYDLFADSAKKTAHATELLQKHDEGFKLGLASAGFDQGFSMGHKAGWDEGELAGENYGRIMGEFEGMEKSMRGARHVLVDRANPHIIFAEEDRDDLISSVVDPEMPERHKFKNFHYTNNGTKNFDYLFRRNAAWIEDGDLLYMDFDNLRKASKNLADRNDKGEKLNKPLLGKGTRIRRLEGGQIGVSSVQEFVDPDEFFKSLHPRLNRPVYKPNKALSTPLPIEFSDEF